MDKVFVEKLAGPSGATMDVVFVHGLTGHLRDTWAVRREDGKLGPPWPCLLERIFPDLGVFTLGYPAPTVRDPTRPSANLTSTAELAFDALKEKGIGDRPLMFVAHSLGGLLCKEIILRGAIVEQSRPENRLTRQTRTILFLGTPHHGARLANIASKLMPQRSRFVRMLRTRDENEFIDNLQRRFVDFAQSHLLDVWSLYEARPMPWPRFLWFSFPVGLVVPRESALAGYGQDKEIDRDHVEMTRVRDEHAPLFKFVVERLTALSLKLTPHATRGLGAAPVVKPAPIEFPPPPNAPAGLPQSASAPTTFTPGPPIGENVPSARQPPGLGLPDSPPPTKAPAPPDARPGSLDEMAKELDQLMRATMEDGDVWEPGGPAR